jgi:nicotinamide phosphoribosyltransferase
MAASSIPASEHSTMVSWTQQREREAYENMLGLFNKKKKLCFE